EYGVWRPVYDHHAYCKIAVTETEKAEFSPTGTHPVEADFPKPLDPVDDLPPTTAITFVGTPQDGKRVVRGTTSDNGTVKRVLVNGQEARALTANFAQWEAILPVSATVSAHAEDTAGNVEKIPHLLK